MSKAIAKGPVKGFASSAVRAIATRMVQVTSCTSLRLKNSTHPEKKALATVWVFSSATLSELLTTDWVAD